MKKPKMGKKERENLQRRGPVASGSVVEPASAPSARAGKGYGKQHLLQPSGVDGL